MIKRVGLKIQQAAEKYYQEKGISPQLSGYAWEFNLIESDQMNAWCMSGGNEPMEFLSTHPSHDTRVADLKALMPEAMKFYKP